jgi:hypothetical protein
MGFAGAVTDAADAAIRSNNVKRETKDELPMIMYEY